MADVTKGARHLVRFALAFGFLAPALVLFGALGTTFGLLDWKFGFGTVTVDWAPKAAMAGIAVGLAAVLFAFADFKRLGILAIAALADLSNLIRISVNFSPWKNYSGLRAAMITLASGH